MTGFFYFFGEHIYSFDTTFLIKDKLLLYIFTKLQYACLLSGILFRCHGIIDLGIRIILPFLIQDILLTQIPYLNLHLKLVGRFVLAQIIYLVQSSTWVLKKWQLSLTIFSSSKYMAKFLWVYMQMEINLEIIFPP